MERAHAAVYQRPAPESAPVRMEPAFDRELALVARRLRFSVPNLSDVEKQLLDDYGRGASRDGEPRYRLITFRSLCAIARRSRRGDDREALAELVRAEVLNGVAPTTVEVAFDAETCATGPADVEQRQFEQHPSPITWARCRDALTRQLIATRTALDAVRTWKMT